MHACQQALSGLFVDFVGLKLSFGQQTLDRWSYIFSLGQVFYFLIKFLLTSNIVEIIGFIFIKCFLYNLWVITMLIDLTKFVIIFIV